MFGLTVVISGIFFIFLDASKTTMYFYEPITMILNIGIIVAVFAMRKMINRTPMLRFNNVKLAGFLVIFISETLFQLVQVMKYTTFIKSYEKFYDLYLSDDAVDTNDAEYDLYAASIGYNRISVVFECIGFFRNLWVLYFLREFMLYQANSLDPVINEEIPTLVLLYG